MKKQFSGLGVMSGTSLDGIDLALCEFSHNEENRWNFNIKDAVTVPYSEDFKLRLQSAMNLSALDFVKLHNDLGKLFAEEIKSWLADKEKPDFIASHGHTIFHRPDLQYTTQIGNGAVIAAETGISVVCDFRSTDVALHGQGAPLVPIGDELLFSNYDSCLNLGGFSNISFKSGEKRVAFDISPCNMALNNLSARIGLQYDKDGNVANGGSVIPKLLENLDSKDYYKQNFPKSLGKEWFDAEILPLLDLYCADFPVPDVLRTFVEHIVNQLVVGIPEHHRSLLVTGGGAHNKFLIQRLCERRPELAVSVPENLITDYKEALIFAFLGLLRLRNETNCLKSVTGAEKDSCCGCVYRG